MNSNDDLMAMIEAARPPRWPFLARTDGPTSPTGGAMAVLVGIDGNAYSIMGHTRQALRRAGASKDYTEAVILDAMSGDYDNLIAVCVAALETSPSGAVWDDDETWEMMR